jgi:hypothetical protein
MSDFLLVLMHLYIYTYLLQIWWFSIAKLSPHFFYTQYSLFYYSRLKTTLQNLLQSERSLVLVCSSVRLVSSLSVYSLWQQLSDDIHHLYNIDYIDLYIKKFQKFCNNTHHLYSIDSIDFYVKRLFDVRIRCSPLFELLF